jgi:hypothetical protein
MLNTVTHVAGNALRFPSGRYLQRCMICGEMLLSGDRENEMIIVGSQKLILWEVGTLVRCQPTEGGSICTRIGFVAPEFLESELPEDTCLELVEL